MTDTNKIEVANPEILRNDAGVTPVRKLTRAEELRLELAEEERKEQAEAERNRTAYEKLKDETVTSLCKTALNLHHIMKDFKDKAFDDSQSFYSMLQEYSARHKDGNGNFTIESKNGLFRISYKRQGKASFDERSHQAEKHIADFLNSKYEGDPETRDFIMELLERKKGELDINLIQKIYKMETRFDDPSWKKGIELLKESYSYDHSKDYINFEHKGERNEWKKIVLQFSSI